MRNQRYYPIVCLLCLVFISSTSAQDRFTQKVALKRGEPPQQQKKVILGPEEKIVRAAYEKLTRLNKAALLLADPVVQDSDAEPQFLQFELGNFRLGPIQEILSSRHSEIITGGSGEIIDLMQTVTQQDKGEERVAYQAKWTAGQYASIYDPNWTIRDLLGFEAGKFYDVGEYALYDVRVSFQGKTRAYRALALFHNAHGSTRNLKPSFWDSVVGSGGSLTQAWNEKRPPIGQNSRLDSGSGSNVPLPQSHHAVGRSFSRLRSLAPRPDGNPSGYFTQSYSENDATVELPASTTEDHRDHTSGGHGERIFWSGKCVLLAGNQQFCRVETAGIQLWENGSTNLIFSYHKNKYAEKIETASGPRGTPISCHRGHGIATSKCFTLNCDFEVGLSGQGASMKMSGGDVWNGELIHRHTCNAPPVTSACPAWARQKCLALGEDWDPVTCRCVAATPVVIDINGDGFALTDKTGGVSFDINADGQPDAISWTTEGSDDAWLSLDRNGNGLIENGRELFGNATPQPPAPEPNGFLALAEYDRAANGGNEDGWIGPNDTVFSALRLWRDSNHNGVSEGSELHTLTQLGVKRLDLDFSTSRRVDEYGNRFRFRAKVKDAQGAQVGRWAWDVYLVH